ncbi:hypothetical protein PCCS19_49260 [Paenibacillus sp. CCS19]|uniref:hypothetical protein n=1 Tax=Paenibacillus sp. CCS19 TaxID=3158387 RepID=UPI00256C2A64|nr:hypothetical protein [Paenibacillus cellulosilyticus]GMK41867.1 hypothetical protein PCCS19_49260 [Paenibacillus cellulosilyticus]
MWLVIGIVILAGFCILIEMPSLRKFKKDLWVFSIAMLAATSISIAAALHVSLPNPLDWAAAVFEPMGESMKRAFD